MSGLGVPALRAQAASIVDLRRAIPVGVDLLQNLVGKSGGRSFFGGGNPNGPAGAGGGEL
jgi:hypothetical protein